MFYVVSRRMWNRIILPKNPLKNGKKRRLSAAFRQFHILRDTMDFLELPNNTIDTPNLYRVNL